jgi:ubiquinone/menaquinone biosynthesis C-methylase UbiE
VKVQCRRGAITASLNAEEASRLLIEEYSRMAREYDGYVTPYHAPIARRLLGLAQVEEGERILDIGCGTGIVAFEAAAAVGEAGSVVGIDLAEGAVRLAADKAAAMGLRHVSFDVMDSRALRFAAGSFDAVLSGFGHPVIERGRCFGEVRRVLGRGGRFALCAWDPSKAPSKGASIRFREILERHRPAVVPPDVARLVEARKVIASTDEGKETQSADGWIRLFRGAGLSSVETVEETHWAAFRGPDAYLEYSFAWGDNERELRHMTDESRESFRREFRERVAPMITEEGLVVDWNLHYFLVRE